ncbi:MAG TPA: dUTP diphosphatase [Desulfobulbus sp.]|nr:dUTP diphosphatase [Desulfobulbus sp.]
MQEIEVQFCWLEPDFCHDLKLPGYETPQSAGMDIGAAVGKPVEIRPGEITLISTGFAVALSEGYELQVRPRSGLAVKHGITVINAPGTIDADYRGEVKVGLVNLSKKSYVVHRGDRIAQLILAPVCRMVLRQVEQLDTTRRGAGGFGHTGR